MTDLLALILAIAGLGLMIFGLGAVSGWSWAVKSLNVKPPRWITAVTAAAGTAMVASFALQGSWFSSVSLGFLFLMIVGGQLQVGPFRRLRGGDPS